MAWTGGKVPMAGIKGSYFTQLATQTASSGVPQALGQVWQGAGQSFFGSAGQALGGALAGSAVNIALNSAFGTDVVGPQGLKLNSGANILASTITPYVTGAVAAGINQNIQQSLKSAGPFGPILSNIGTSLVDQTFNGLTDSIFGATDTATNYLTFPGGGIEASYSSSGEVSIRKVEEPEADYGGSAYTLTDVLFSLQPANQGPQLAGDAQAANASTVSTTVATNQVAGAGNMAGVPGNNGVNELKAVAMNPDIDKLGTNSTTPFRTAEQQIYDRAERGEIVIIQDGPNGILYRTRETQKLYAPR
jgi:hypothetical protein